MTQPEITLRLRAAIDTAITHPGRSTVEAAVEFAKQHPMALRSSHMSHNLGQRRWAWLNSHGVYQVRGDITPDTIK